jgi:DNA-binding MarR family transcriptional regulator
VGDYEILLARMADANSPEFLEIDITMPQAKVLYLLTAGDLHLSDLVARLGVTLPTVSGVVDRLVEHGLVARRSAESDRRRVFVGLTSAGSALIDRFRDLNARQIRDLLSVLDDEDLESMRGFLAVLDRGVSRLAGAVPITTLASTAARAGASRSAAS